MYVYKCLEKYCSVAQPSVQITDLWTPFTGFILIVRIFPTKRETKSDGMYGKKKKKSVILAPLFFPTWSNRRMRDRDKLVERRTGKLCWEIKLVTLFSVQHFAGKTVVAGAAKKKKKKKKKKKTVIVLLSAEVL